MKPECSVVVPVCNEERNLPTLHLRLSATLRKLAIPYEIIYVDDGSTDATPRLIADLREQDKVVKALFLSRNFGHQAALCAGLEAATGRTVISIDGDLQDPPELIPELLAKWHEGYQVVYARRRRRNENPLKVSACYAFYRMLRKISDIPIPVDTGDYALMDRRALDVLNSLPERSRFIRGLRSWVGFKQAEVEYDREPRRDGESKYSIARLFHLAFDGFVGFSDKPLKFILTAGVALQALAVVAAVATAVFRGMDSGALLWSGMAFLAGVQLFFLGIIGHYVARIHQEVRNRPLYLVSDRLGFRTQPRSVPNVVKYIDSEMADCQESATTLRYDSIQTAGLTLRDEFL